MNAYKIILALLLPLLPVSAQAYLIDGELTPGDFLTTDSTSKTFHYDIYNITNVSASSTVVEVTLTPNSAMRPWLTYWNTPTVPDADWESPSSIYTTAVDTVSSGIDGAQVSLAPFIMNPGDFIQLVVTTADYLEDGADIGSYVLDIDGAGLQITAVPVPAAVWLLLTGLVSLGLMRKQIETRG